VSVSDGMGVGWLMCRPEDIQARAPEEVRIWQRDVVSGLAPAWKPPAPSEAEPLST
jgi:hypothetical protein